MTTTTTLTITAACRILPGKAWQGSRLVLDTNGAAEVFLPELYRRIGLHYPKWYKMDKLAQLGILAAELLLGDPVAGRPEAPESTAIVMANRYSSLDTDTRFVAQLQDIPSPAIFVYTLPNIAIGEISIRQGIKGEQAFFISEQPDWDFLVKYAEVLFAEGQTQQCILGWLDFFRGDYRATVFTISCNAQANGWHLNKENLYQYHEQGAIN